jgi:hypothetical protein
VKEIQELVSAGDWFAAIERIQGQGDSSQIAGRYASLVADLYWKAHDLPAVIAIGRAGILYCLGKSLEADVPRETAGELRSVAKGMAYDVGSFTWPGWEEPGINPTPQELLAGRECAQLNLRLAIELKKPAERVSMAHWLVGAHALAAGDARGAEDHFQLARDLLPATEAAAQATEFLNEGYLAIARLCGNPADAATRARLDQIIAQLGASDDEDAGTYRAQLLTARRLFTSAG